MLIKLGSFNVFLHEMNEFGKEKYCSTQRTKVLIVKIDYSD